MLAHKHIIMYMHSYDIEHLLVDLFRMPHQRMLHRQNYLIYCQSNIFIVSVREICLNKK